MHSITDGERGTFRLAPCCSNLCCPHSSVGKFRSLKAN